MGFIVHRAAGGHTLLRQIAGDTLRIGRDAGAELRLDDDAVALDHAAIRGGDGSWTLEDRGSVTGTYLGGSRVRSAKLAAGDVIEIGGFRIRVQITHPEDPLFVHVAAVGAGAAESPRAARGSSTGSLRLDELVARARETGRRPPPSVTDTGPLRRLAELAAATRERPGPAAGSRPTGAATDTGPLRRLGEIAAAAEGAPDPAARRPRPADEAEAETAAIRVAPPADPRPAEAEAAADGREPGTAAVELPPEREPETAAVELPPEPAPEPGRRPAPPPPAAVPAAAAPRIDYAAAYALRRPGLTKGLATLLAAVVAAVAVAALGASGSRTWLMPGISSAHARIVGAAGSGDAGAPAASPANGSGGTAGLSAPGAAPGAAPPGTPSGASSAAASLASRRGEVAELGCRACHSPWRGPVEVEGCAACHPRQAGPHGAALAGSAAVPACAACHPEHRDRPLVAANDEGPCLSCHRDLGAIPTAAEPAVARRVTSFAAEHPELVAVLPAAGGGERRLRLDDPAAAGADPAVLRFGHRLHQAHEEGEPTAGPPLRPTTGLGPAEIEERLRCGSCHQPDPASGRMQPVEFERHCQACHALSFDAERFPDCQVPHQAPAEVEGFLLLTFVQGTCPGGADSGGADAGGSLADRRRAERVRALGMIGDDDPRRRRFQVQVDRAMAKLFGSECVHCHLVDLDAEPRPAVEPPAIPAVWMPGARFSHLDHEGVACAECHAGAAASERTADLLLPGIAVCRSCHGERRDHPQASRLLSCGECHDYHGDPGREATRVALRTPENARTETAP